MPEFDKHGYQGFWLPARRLNGEHGVVVVVKRRFDVNTTEAICEPSDETPPVGFVAAFYDDADPPDVSVRHPAEVAPEKRHVDVMVRGTAYAPGGKAVPEFEVKLKIPGVLERSLRIIGDRKLIWYPPVKELTYKDLAKGEEWLFPDPDFSEPAPIDKIPLRYEYAFGGYGKLVMTEDEEEMAEEAQGVEEVVEKRRERKKEIEAELKAEEDGAKQAKKDAGKPKEKITDAKAKALADDVFSEYGARDDGAITGLDDETLRRLAAEDDGDDGMKVVSALRLGQHMPVRPEDEANARDAGDADADADADEAGKDADPDSEFFSSAGATAAFDINAMAAGSDELRALLMDEDVEAQRKLKDEEGVLRDRATEFGDIKLSGDDWAAKYVKNRPKKKKKKRETSEFPEIPYAANPTGKGFCVNPREEAVEGVALPNIEDPEDPLTEEGFIYDLAEFDLKKLRTPAGWAPYPMGWYPRAQYFGVYPWDMEAAEEGKKQALKEWDEDDYDDQKTIEAIEGLEIPVMQMRAYQEAHPSMWAKEVRGDEEVYMTNLTPEGMLFFRLPGLHPSTTIEIGQGPMPLAMRIDTVLFDMEDPKKPAVELCWRGWQPLRDFDQVGEMPVDCVNIIEVDQTDWIDIKRDEARDEKKSAAGSGDSAEVLSDDDLDQEDAMEAYKRSMRRGRGGVGVRMDGVTDAVVFDQTEGRQLSDDDWDKEFRDEKDGFEDDAKLKAEEIEALKDKARKAKAREQVDEEFGIIRDDDGEILVHDGDDD